MADTDSALFYKVAEQWDDSKSYLRRPASWCRDKLKEHLWSQQKRILRSLRDNRYTVVHSAHELGKSKIAANAVAWWTDSHPPGEAFVVTTAPTAAQVSAILWREINKNHSKGELAGKINRAGYPQWFLGNELVGYGRKPADYEESAFQGIHARYVLVVIDEAGGVAKQLFNAIDSLVANEHARVLAIGNPDDPSSHFSSLCKPDSDWNVIHLDGLRSPNMSEEQIVGDDPANPKYPLLTALMKAEGIPFSTEVIPYNLRELLISPLWVEERIRRWAGFSNTAHTDYAPDELAPLLLSRTAASPIFTSKVRGIFPSATSEGVIPLGWVQMAVNRWKDWESDYVIERYNNMRMVPIPGRKVVGIDVARGGEDETVFSIRNGNVVRELIRFRIADTMETADAAAMHLDESGALAVVDVIGIGAGVYDMLRRMKREGTIQAQAIPFNAAAQTPRTDLIGQFRFRNDRAAAWWKMRELLDPSRGSRICLPDDERLIEELVSVKYEMLVGGVIKIESKDEIRKRLGRSTDSADAVIQSFWVEGLGDFETLKALPYDTRASHSTQVVNYNGHTPITQDDFDDTLGRMAGGLSERAAVWTGVASGRYGNATPDASGWGLDTEEWDVW